MPFRQLGLLVCTVALVAACASDVPLGKPDLGEEQIQASAEGIRAPGTTRAAVHEALGEPWISTDRRDAEVFRLSGKQHRMLLVFAPFPVPLPMPGERLEGYTLVTYSDDGVVAAVDSAFARSETFGRTHSLMLRAGDYEFEHETRDTLSVALERFQRELAAVAPRPTGTVIVGCEGAADAGSPAGIEGKVCFTRVEIDGGERFELPLVRFVTWPLAPPTRGPAPVPDPACRDAGGRTLTNACLVERGGLYPLLLDPGRHSLRFTTRELDGEASGTFDCVPGGIVFAVLRDEKTESYSMSRQLSSRLKVGAATGSLTVSDAAPEDLRSQKVTVYVDGNYLLRRQAQP